MITRASLNQLSLVIAIVLLLLNGRAVAGDAPFASPKSESTGTTIAIGATAAPIALSVVLIQFGGLRRGYVTFPLVIGILCGPGAGHAYAGNEVKFRRGVRIRSFIGIAGLVAFMNNDGTFPETLGGRKRLRSNETAEFVMIVSASLLVVSMFHDIATTGDSVGQYNAQLAQTRPRFKPFAGLGRHGLQAGLQLSF